MSLPALIIQYARANDWVSGLAYEDLARTWGYKASNGSRRCRDLVKDGKLEPRYAQVNGKGPHVVQYKYIDPMTGLRPEVIRERLQQKLI